MRFLLINQYCGFGSTGKIVQDLHDMIINYGHECCIAYGRYEASQNYNTYKIGGSFNNYTHVLETRLLDNHGFSSRYATKKFVDFIEKYKPDVVHIHNLHGYYINIKILMEYLKKKNIKIIWTFHDCWNFSRHSGYIDYNSMGALPTKLTSKKELSEYPKAYYSPFDNYHRKKKVFTGFKDLTVITPSNWLTSMVDDTFFNEYPHHTIYNGVDLSKFYVDINNNLLKKYKIEDKKIILGVASVWDKRKGLRYMNQLAERIDHSTEKIVVIGKIEENISLNKDILHITHTTDINEMRQWYSNAMVFVNPTMYDNFPTTNIEAMLCGTPVITFNTGGSPEAIKITKVGKIVPRGDISALFDAIRKIKIESKESISEKSKVFSKENKYQEYFKYYL